MPSLIDLRGPRAVHGVQGRLSRVVVDQVVEAVAGVGIEAFVAERPRRHLAPFWRQEWRGFSGDHVAALVDEQVQREGLPPVQVFHGFVAIQIDNQGGVHRLVHGVGVPVRFVGAILKAKRNQLRCKVIGEGGNLGLTQRARIEFSLHGGRINTDFIDNSAGVDSSDREVNIKILLSDVVKHRQL
ncbi:MAG: NAD-glutamate dehydrogenase domain-containing protein, partial [Flavobacteriales bacterium]